MASAAGVISYDDAPPAGVFDKTFRMKEVDHSCLSFKKRQRVIRFGPGSIDDIKQHQQTMDEADRNQ